MQQGVGACNERNMFKQEHVYLCLQSGTTTTGDVDTPRQPNTVVLFGFVFQTQVIDVTLNCPICCNIQMALGEFQKVLPRSVVVLVHSNFP